MFLGGGGRTFGTLIPRTLQTQVNTFWGSILPEWQLSLRSARHYQHRVTLISYDSSWGPEVEYSVHAHKQVLDPMVRTIFKDLLAPKTAAKYVDAMTNSDSPTKRSSGTT